MRCETNSAKIYLDTSVFLKEFSEEPKSEVIHRIFEMCRQRKVTIVTSRWTINESIAALDKKHNRGEITDFERDQVIFTMLRKVEELIDEGQIFAISLSNDVARFSTAIITDKHLSADDALHLYSAIVGKCDALVLADNRFAKLAKDGGDFEVFNILDENNYNKLEAFLTNIR
ncbi:MAG: type II toxin-antitoxin system VapC family toxin [Nitrososphaerales archaeon]